MAHAHDRSSQMQASLTQPPPLQSGGRTSSLAESPTNTASSPAMPQTLQMCSSASGLGLYAKPHSRPMAGLCADTAAHVKTVMCNAKSEDQKQGLDEV